MNLTLIAAMAENRVIGRDNDLIWHLPRDLRHFKELTSGHHIIMGRKTYESMGKPLPHRINIVVTRNKDFKAKGCIIVNSLDDAIKKVDGQDKQPFIAGGAEIYQQALPYANTIELTLIHHSFEGDARFPEINMSEWQEAERNSHKADEKNPYNMDFIRYTRKQ